jgi:8-oxo-dGTP pyrophosphatase MutT (NUDIX family)
MRANDSTDEGYPTVGKTGREGSSDPSPDPGDEWVDVVDDEDRVLSRARRREVRARNLFHRGVGILCWDSLGRVYVHRRTRSKDIFPGLYDMFVGGVVGSGESTLDAARREIQEELGILGPEPQWLFSHTYVGPHNRAHVAVYQVVWDGPMRHQASEVEWGAFFTLEDLEEKLREWTFVPDGLEIFARLQSQGFKQSALASTPASGKGTGGAGPPEKR